MNILLDKKLEFCYCILLWNHRILCLFDSWQHW